MFELWTQRAIDVMILASKPILSVVIQWIKFVAPFPREVKPLSRGVGCSIGSGQRISDMIVSVCENIEGRIPKRAAICFVVEDSEREDIWVCTWSCIHCMGANCRINDRLSQSAGQFYHRTFYTYSIPDFLHGRVVIR